MKKNTHGLNDYWVKIIKNFIEICELISNKLETLPNLKCGTKSATKADYNLLTQQT